MRLLYTFTLLTTAASTLFAQQATPVSDIKVADGFQVELLHSVDAKNHGSWVSIAALPDGQLIVSDQYGKLHRVTPPATGQSGELKIETINLEVGRAHGLLWHRDSLYIMVNEGDRETHGLHVARDTDGDGTLDQVEFLRHLQAGGEHGAHSIVPAPDGNSLYVCAGNHTNPTDYATSRVPKVWKEDQLLTRMWDAGGHAVGKMAPGGWIAKVSLDGKDWELVSSGFRNEFDIAFNTDGELFTYDADMEWDVGTPWYRPTRINHVTSGSEFGWRSGTGKWPAYYPDSLPAVVDIGPGSPTGIAFGTGAKFPAKYQKALYTADWSYGIINAVHLTPDGSSYTGTFEPFVTAAPLPVTDIVIGSDGAMYFAIGGRRTQSGLYRVTYTDNQSTAADTTASSDEQGLRALRQSLEALHNADSEDAVEKAWPHLGHADRHIRYAARIAVEHRPLSEWAAKALAESSSVNASLTALLALTRHGDDEYQSEILRGISRIARQQMSEDQTLALLRVLQLTFIRLGEPEEAVRTAVGEALAQFFPADSPRINREMCALLIYLQHPDTAETALQLMRDASTQEDAMYYSLILRELKAGWTTDSRTQYFNWFLGAGGLRGGHSFSGFLKNIRNEAINHLSDTEKEALKEVLAKSPAQVRQVIPASTRPLVQKWTVKDLLADSNSKLQNRNFETGRKMFVAAGCYQCHRISGRGGIIGPDLTAVGRRFNNTVLLESLIEPSKVISDQYAATVFVTSNGKQVIGRVANLNNDQLMISENMLDPGHFTRVKRSDIEESFISDTSMMPQGLINNLTRDEILDLMAYLKSGADPNSNMFK